MPGTELDVQSDDELVTYFEAMSTEDGAASVAERIHENREGKAMFHAAAAPSQYSSPPPTLKNGTSSQANNETSLLNEIDALSDRVADLMEMIYEAQEQRHLASSSTKPANLSRQLVERIRTCVNDLSPIYIALADKVAMSSERGAKATISIESMEELSIAWEKVCAEVTLLEEETRANEWLESFRATADRADALLDPLQKSLDDSMLYVDRVMQSPVGIPYTTELDDELSMFRLDQLFESQRTMQGSYGPTINRTLKQMERFLTGRPARNGEALRRFGEMQTRWHNMQRQFQQLEAKVRLAHSRNQETFMSPDDMEVLHSPHVSAPDLFATDGKAYDKSPMSSHRSSISSGFSASSAASMVQRKSIPSPQPPPIDLRSLEGLRPPTLRRRSSMMSDMSGRTAKSSSEKPRWNVSTKPVKDDNKTPTANRRFSSYGTPPPVPAIPARFGAFSPTPSSASTTAARPGAIGSRIPVMSPGGPGTPGGHAGRKSSSSMDWGVQSLAVPNPIGLSSPANAGRASRTGMRTPEPKARPRLSAAQSAMAPRTAAMSPQPGLRTTSFGSSGLAPRSVPHGRQSLGRAPPSSFRSMTPTPSGTRPSSRLSMASAAVPSVPLQPFQASKYDLLDQEVSRILAATGFDLFVSRLDPAVKKSQRVAEGQEWKGEFVFGAGERPAQVKLVKHVGRAAEMQNSSWRVMVRVGGAWTELAEVLRKRKADMGETF